MSINRKTITVYPCVYREHIRNSCKRHLDDGLSLCIQGTPHICYLCNNDRRFIPVYTGNTAPLVVVVNAITVYPCVYREHGRVSCRRSIRARFIPVYTGNTIPAANGDLPEPVYPCVYREHLLTVYLKFVIGGLSLCIQGTQKHSSST